MAGHDNYNSSSGDDRNLGRYLWLGAIETLLNAFIDLDAGTRDRVHSLHGLIVRVKLMDPYLPFYLFFTEEGIEVSEEAPAPAQVRINARLFDLMRMLLGAAPLTASGRPRIRVWGDAENVAQLESLLVDFNLRTRAQQWLREHLNLESLWQKIRNHDPSWLQDFLPLPGLMRETLGELRRLNHNLEMQQLEFERHRQRLQRQRLYDLLVLALFSIALVGSFTDSLSLTQLRELGTQQLMALTMALLLLLSRFRA